MYEETFMAWCILYFNKGKYRNVLLGNMRVKLQNVTFASEHVRELSASVAKSKKQYIYGIKLKFLTKFLNRIYEKFEQREAIRTFCSENLEHVLSLLRGPVY